MKFCNRLVLSLLAVLALDVGASGQSAAIPSHRSWVVKEVISPAPGRSFEPNWFTAIAFRDLTGDGRPELFKDEWRIFPSTGEHWYSMTSGVPLGTPRSVTLGIQPLWKPFFSLTTPCSGMISRPVTGLAISGLERPSYSLPILVDLSSGAIIDRFVAPPGGPGQEKIGLVRYMRSPGDVTLDGVEDFFFQAWTEGNPNVSTSGLIDGATFDLVWQSDVAWTSAMVQAEPYYPLAETDLDHDGRPEFIAGVVFSNFSTLQEGTLLRAMRGYDGQLLWETQLPAIHLSTPACTLIHDVTGDGISEVVLGGGADPILAVDGSDGSLLWQLPMSEVEPLLPPSTSTVGYVEAFILSVPGGPPSFRTEAVVQIAKWADRPGGGSDYTIHLLRLDAKTGSILTLQSLDGDLQPWSPDPLVHWDNSYQHPVGDVDRDGFPEFFHDVHALSLDLPHLTGVPSHFVLFGIETLSAPDTASIGEQIDCRLGIPSAPNHSFRVLASTQFDASGGLQLDGWPTHLGPSAALTASFAAPLASGTLDANGIATFSWSTPVLPALAGKTIYSRAVILKPGTTSSVWTLSTLGRTLLVP
jgi:hypothetical protein